MALVLLLPNFDFKYLTIAYHGCVRHGQNTKKMPSQGTIFFEKGKPGDGFLGRKFFFIDFLDVSRHSERFDALLFFGEKKIQMGGGVGV